MDYMANIIEKIIVERNKKVDSAILGEIQQIAVENGIETKIVLNEKAVVDALRSYQDGYAAIKAKVAREILTEVNMQIYPYSTDIYIKGEELIIIPKTDYNQILEELKKKYT